MMKHSVETVKLKNGAEGLLIDIPGASVMCTRVHFRGGMQFAKSPEVREVAHLVEHLSFGANSVYRDEQAYEADFTRNGAYHNAWTSDSAVCYETECADFEWDRILNLKRIAVTSPRFREEELESEKKNVRSELTGHLNDYSWLLWLRLQKLIGEDTPSLKERIATLPNIEVKDIREHYRRTHTTRNMRFVIAGEVHKRRREILRSFEAWDLKPGERFEIPEHNLHAGAPILIRRKDASNLTFGFSFVVPRRLTATEMRNMKILNQILTGTMSSRIFGQARKKGLAYGISSTAARDAHSSSWDFDGEVSEEDAPVLFDLIAKELNQVLNGKLAEEDVEAAKSYALGRYQMGAQTVAHIADFYAGSYFADGTYEDYSSLPQAFEKTTGADLIALAREFVASGISGLVAVGSCEKPLISELAEKIKF